MFRIILQIFGVLALLLALTLITLRVNHRDADGPSILFPGGELTSGELHTGAEPDWSFTDEVQVVELQLEEPLSSRRIFIMESGGKAYVPSGYMRSFLGRLWKEWAFQAAEGDGLAVVRINGMRFERKLVRITDESVLPGVVAKLTEKYAGGATPEAIENSLQAIANGDTWIFELAPRDANL